MKIEDVLRLVRKNISGLAPYSTARDEYKGALGVFLDANENPFENGYNRYPDPRQQKLKEIISNIKSVPAEQIFVGNGSDEAIDLCYRIFCEPRVDNVVTISPTYGMYRVAADINDVEVREVALNSDFSLPIEQLLATCDEHTKLMFVCSPNNPSGNIYPIEQIKQLLDSFSGILVVDEAYIDFANQNSVATLLSEYKNLIVLQTLSKAYGLAALRLGLAFADESVMQLFAKVKYPYNINLAGMEQAAVLLKRDVRAEIEKLKNERERLSAELVNIPGVLHVYPSDANFILVKIENARDVYDFLIAQQIIVRDRSHVPGCEDCLRITVGTPAENERLIAVMKNRDK